jgi:predicted outer membrane protein
MNQRRVLLTGIAAALASPVFAQAQQGAQAQQDPSGSRLGNAEMNYIKSILPIGSLSLATSRLATQKASDHKVMEFARFETAEQETIADVLNSLQNPGNVSGEVKPPNEQEVEQNLDQQGREMLRMLQSERGAGFDRTYVSAQTDGHRQLLKIQADYLKSGRNLATVNVAKLASGMIKEHLQLLSDIEQGMKTTGSGTRRR